MGGTSLVVYPAAGFLDFYRGDKLVVINLDETSYHSRAALAIHEKIGQVLGLRTTAVTSRTITGMRGSQTRVQITLKAVWALAICREMTSTSGPLGESCWMSHA